MTSPPGPGLAELCEVVPDADDVFLPAHHPGITGEVGRLYGGHLAAQALSAAAATVKSSRPPHSVHAHFLRPGRLDHPVLLKVERTREGGSFSTRRVVAEQDGEAVLVATASFHEVEEGLDYELPSAAFDPPQGPVRPRGASSNPYSPLEVVQVPWEREPPGGPQLWSTRRMWVRSRTPLPADPVAHACAMVYVSDLAAVSAVERAVAARGEAGMRASLDHTVWVHRSLGADGWMLLDMRPVGVRGARGLAFGTVHVPDGALLASVSQEALLRPARQS
jgi:acyl-CoA thioesterase-2